MLNGCETCLSVPVNPLAVSNYVLKKIVIQYHLVPALAQTEHSFRMTLKLTFGTNVFSSGGRFKKEIVVDGQSYLLLIRDEGGPPELQVRLSILKKIQYLLSLNVS